MAAVEGGNFGVGAGGAEDVLGGLRFGFRGVGAVEQSDKFLAFLCQLFCHAAQEHAHVRVAAEQRAAVEREVLACVDIVTVVLTNIDFSDAFEKTVEDKMIAEQEKLKAEYEKETAIVNAEKELEVAKLAAQAKLEAAKADAEAVIEVAKAEATAIQLKSVEVARALGFSITEVEITDEAGVVTGVEYTIDFAGKSAEEIALITDYLKYMEYLATWDGKLPSVMTSDSATVMIPTPSN